MRKFSLSLSSYIGETIISVYELHKDGSSLFAEFVEEIQTDGNLLDSLAGAIRVVEETSNLRRYPRTKFRELQAHNLNCKVYEAKYKLIRIYLFHQEKTGRVIITGGLKNDQKQDIKSILKTIKEYYDELGEK